MTIHPFSSDVLVEFTRPLEGLIVIPQAAEQKPTTGKVIALGEKVTLVKHGDTVLVDLFKGKTVEHADGRILRLFKESELLATFPGTILFNQSGTFTVVAAEAPAPNSQLSEYDSPVGQ